MPQLPAGIEPIETDKTAPVIEPIQTPNFKTETLASESNPSLFDQLYNQVSSAKNFISDELTRHPTIRQIGQRFLTGESPEDVAAHGSLLGNTSGNSLLPEWQHPIGEGWPGYLMRGAYNQLIRPIASPAGILGAAKFGDIVNPKLPVKPEVNPAVAEDIITRKEMPGTSNTLEEIDAARDRAAQRRVDQFSRSHGIEPEKINTDIPLPSANETPASNVTPLIPKTATEPLVLTPQQKLIQAVKTARPIRGEQEALYTAEKGKRISEALSSTKSGEEWAKEYMSALKGSYPKVEYTGVQLEQGDIDSLLNDIKTTPKLTNWEKPRAITGLSKITSGSAVPQDNELKALQRVFGPEINRIQRTNMVSQAVNFPKAMLASLDLSAPFRQGMGLIHRGEWWRSWDDMVKSFGSEDFFNNLQESIREAPHFPLSQEAGLSLTDLTHLSSREERFMSDWAEKIPGVRASNRAYTGFLNKLRSDTFNSMVESAKKAGIDPTTNLPAAEAIAKYINTATGRGNLGELEKSAVVLNNIFFSPRFVKSRLDMLNPVNYVKNPVPGVRQGYWISALNLSALGGTMAGLAKMAGADVSLNPTSADYGKIKIGRTRIDPYAGEQQFMVLLDRLRSNETTSSTSNKTTELGSKYGTDTRGDILREFLGNKLAPVPKVGYDWLFATRKRPFVLPNEIAQTFIPLMIQDIYSVAQRDPELLPITIPASATGFGVQSYGR